MLRQRLTFVWFLVAALTALLLFQNCDSMKSSGSLSAASLSPEASADLASSGGGNGNGNGYDGKVFVHLRDGSVCGDGTAVDSKIQFRSQKSYLTRENCVDVPLSSQLEIKVDLDPNNRNLIYYQGRTYREYIVRYEQFVVSPGGERYLWSRPFHLNGGFPTGSLSLSVIGRVDAVGITLWSADLEVPSERSTYFGSITPASGGGLDALATVGPKQGLGPYHALVLSLNSSGALTAGKVLAGQANSYFLNVTGLLRRGTDLFVSGYVNLSGPYEDVGFIAKIKADGTMDWVRSFAGPNDSLSRIGQIKLGQDGDLYLEGVRLNRRLIAKMSTEGVVRWSKVIDEMRYGVISTNSNRFVATPDGGVVLAGNFGSHHALLKLSSAGATLWSKTFTTSDSSSTHIHGLIEESGGDILMTGVAYLNGQASSGLLATVSSIGQLKWMYHYRLSGRDSFEGDPIRVGNSYWLLGQTISSWKPAYLTGFVAVVPINVGTMGCAQCALRTDARVTDVQFTITNGPSFDLSSVIQIVSGNVEYKLRSTPLYFELPK